MERERTRGRQEQKVKEFFRWEGGEHVLLLREPRGGRKGTAVARATILTERMEKMGRQRNNWSLVGGR